MAFRTAERCLSGHDPIAVIRYADQNGVMISVVYLSPGEDMPDHGDNMRWLRIEASDDGRFFGSGGSFKANGDWVGYGSLAEDDVSLEAALAAAQQWAAKYDVPTIWIQLAP